MPRPLLMQPLPQLIPINGHSPFRIISWVAGLLVLAACQSTSEADAAIRDHVWSRALLSRGPREVAEVSSIVSEHRESVPASLPYYRFLAPKPPAFTLVFLHGDPGGKEVWAQLLLGSDFPTSSAEGLADIFDTIAIDLPGHGQSESTSIVTDPHAVGQIVEGALAAISSQTGPIRGELVLVGHSYGGEVAWRMAMRNNVFPRIARLVLVDSVGMARKPREIQDSEHTFASWFWDWLLGGIFGSRESDAKAGLIELYSPQSRELIESNEVARLYQAYVNRGHNYWASRAITLRDLARLDDRSTIEALRSLRVPTLLIWGADDPAWTLQTQGIAFRRFIPGAALAVIKECGHLPTEERPGVLASVLRSWLEGSPPSSGIANELTSDSDDWFRWEASPPKHGDRWTTGLGIEFVYIAPRTFTMGSPDRFPNEKQHRVALTSGYWMAVTEITQQHWKRVMGTEPWKGEPDVREGADIAASYVSWEMASEWCRRANELDKKRPPGFAYRLPTEAEWECACRAGTTTAYCFGDSADELGDYAWFEDNAKKAGEDYGHAVGRKRANSWELHDMHGNVWEWCLDASESAEFGVVADTYRDGVRDPVSRKGWLRVVRGGSSSLGPQDCRSAFRFSFEPFFAWGNSGFRPGLTPIPAEGGAEDAQLTDREAPPRSRPLKHGDRWATSLNIGLVYIAPRTFTMGSPQSEEGRGSDETQHDVTLTLGYWMAVTEITQEQWKRVMGTEPWKGNVRKGWHIAASYINWEMAAEWCKRANDLDEKLPPGFKYRLPTEAEWECACRGGTKTAFGFGDDASKLGRYAWFARNMFFAGRRHANPVARKRPNAWDLYDMHGNLGEWCLDAAELKNVDFVVADTYRDGVTDPLSKMGSRRVMRGGNWFKSGPRYFRSARRYAFLPGVASSMAGFRPVLAPARQRD